MANANMGRDVASRRQGASEIDRHVAGRLRERRRMLGLTQRDMAAQIGISFRMLCKYEYAINRVTSGRLHGMAIAMDVDVKYFFQDMEHLEPHGLIASPLWYPALIELSQHFLDMPDHHRQAFRVIARALADGRDGKHSPLMLITPAMLAEVLTIRL